MIIRTVIVGFLETNCYLLSGADSGDALVVDPGGDPGKILKAIEQKNLNVKAILLTHGHHDHTGAIDGVREKFKVPVLLHEQEADFMRVAAADRARFGESGEKKYALLKDGDVIDLAGLSVKVLFTPGHTPGGVCFLSGSTCVTGDTLFQDGVGRSDFPGGDEATLQSSIRQKLMTLPDDTRIFPGHGAASTIGIERKYFD